MARLYDPAPTDGGGTPIEVVRAPEGTTKLMQPVHVEAKPEPKAETKPGKVEVDESELKSMRDRLAEIDKAEADRKKAEKAKADEEARARGEYEKLLRDKDSEIHDRESKLIKARGDYEALERDTARSFVEGQLAIAVALPNLVEKAPEQLMKLFRDEFRAAREDGRWVVKSLDGRTPAEFVKAEIEKPDYAHFRKAPHQGGGGGGNGVPDAAAPDVESARQQYYASVVAARNGMGGAPGVTPNGFARRN